MRFRLYIDEDRLSRALIAALISAGFDVLPCSDAGMIRKSDEEHLALATSLGRVVYTANSGDFARLHVEWLSTGKSHAGIICCNSQYWSIGEQLRRVRAVDAERSAADMVDRFVYLSSFG